MRVGRAPIVHQSDVLSNHHEHLPGSRVWYNTCWLAVWLSDNALASINIAALCQTRLVLGWVTICGRVNHLGM